MHNKKPKLIFILFFILIYLLACSDSSPEKAKKELLKLNIDFNEKNFIHSIDKEHPERVYLFLQAGMNPNTNFRDFQAGSAPVIIMAANRGNIDILKMLIDKGADINATINKRPILDTSLTTAIKGGHIKIVSLLLKSNADLSIVNSKGKSIIEDAIEYAKSWSHLKGHPSIEKIREIEKLLKNNINKNSNK